MNNLDQDCYGTEISKAERQIYHYLVKLCPLPG